MENVLNAPYPAQLKEKYSDKSKEEETTLVVWWLNVVVAAATSKIKHLRSYDEVGEEDYEIFKSFD